MKSAKKFEYIDLNLLVYGIDPDKVSKIMDDFQPSQSREADRVARISRTGQTSRIRPHYWSKSSEVEVASDDLDRHLNWFTNYLSEKVDQIAEITRLPEAEVWVNITLFSGEQSSIFLPSDLLSVLSKLGTGVMVSIYDYSETNG